MSILQKLNAEQGITVVLVTHDPDLAAHARRIIHIRDGRIISDEPVAKPLLAAQVLAAMPVVEEG
jgi:putative ABC transport system ATP-binding protein